MFRYFIPTFAVATMLISCSSHNTDTGYSTVDVPATTEWQPDSLGNRFEKLTFRQPDDKVGYAWSTVVRRQSDCPDSHRALIYIHGFNDYFFQSQMADSFAAHGFNFYAVDLRRYGRSLRPGQYPCDISSMAEYFPDIDSTLSVIRKDGNTRITMLGHSTGGLLAAYYMSLNHDSPVDSLMLNSPFLDWNLGSLEHWIWAVDLLADICPSAKIPQGHSDAYSHSLLKKYNGRWDFNTSWKREDSPDVTARWVRAVDKAQNYLHAHPLSVDVPVLLMYSSQSYHGSDYTPEASRSDAVLDVNDIKRYGMELSRNVTPLQVEGGLHDLVLSSSEVLAKLYPAMFRWLKAPVCDCAGNEAPVY